MRMISKKVLCIAAISIAILPAILLRAQSAHKQVNVDPKIFDGYVGQYQLAPNLVWTVTRDGAHLFWQGVRDRAHRDELFPENERDYYAKADDFEFRFKTDDHGIAVGMVLLDGTREVGPIAARVIEHTQASLEAQCAAVDSMVANSFASHRVGSITVGVVYKNQLIWTKSYGNADMDRKLPADKDTVYRIGSITKMFTAVMLEQLADDGKVHLSDPVEKYFPEIKTVQTKYPDASPVTFIELATHTSGLDREPGDTDRFLHGQIANWEKTLIAALPHTHFAFEPGTHYSYSNIGFAILGAALARAAAQPYVEYVPQHIFQPLGMTHTALELTPEMQPHLSRGYHSDGVKADDSESERDHRDGRGYKVPNGAIYTTVGDLARFCSFLLGEGPASVLKTSTLDRNLNQSAVQANFQLSRGYTLGGMVIRRDNYIAFGHGGAVAGYQAGLYVNRDAKIGVIVLANSDVANPDGLAQKALDILSK